MDQLAAQALKGASEGADLEKQIQEALACPCVADLREGPCGPTFVDAFSCYIRSDHEEKGMDCLDDFKMFQECLKRHPGHVEAIMADAEGAAGEGGAGQETAEREPTAPAAPQTAPSQ